MTYRNPHATSIEKLCSRSLGLSGRFELALRDNSSYENDSASGAGMPSRRLPSRRSLHHMFRLVFSMYDSSVKNPPE
jgi:hypothetical protein